MVAYTLYNRRGSGGFAVEAALTLADLPFQLIDVGTEPSTPLPDSFRKVNPWGQVPVLTSEDGLMMTETGAILIYLAGAHDTAGLGPKPWSQDHATFLRWVTFLSVNIYESTLRVAYPARYTDDPDGAEAVRAAGHQRRHEAFQMLEADLQPGAFLMGEMTAADIYFAMLFGWHKIQPDLPKCAALTHSVAAHPVIAPVWRRNFDHRMPTKWGR